MTKVEEALAQMEGTLAKQKGSVDDIAADIVSGACAYALNRPGPGVATAHMDILRADIAAAILAEREACAKIAETASEEEAMGPMASSVALEIAAAIRARGKE